MKSVECGILQWRKVLKQVGQTQSGKHTERSGSVKTEEGPQVVTLPALHMLHWLIMAYFPLATDTVVAASP